MLRFEDPIYLWLLWLIPVLALVRFVTWRQRKSKLKKFGDPALLKDLMPDASRFRPSVKFWLANAALAVLIVMLARPQMGSKISHEKRNGIEAIICMDISNSMRAEDVAPSRLDRCKMLVENMVDHFTNDKIGLVVFAGDAFVQLPITSDYVSAKMFLQNTDPSLIQTQGTDIARAIDVAMHSFTKQEKVGRAIIVITDGEDHEGGALEAAQAAKKAGINVFILGVGSSKGAPIPLGNGNYMQDNAGQTVMTALNEQMCKEIAQAGSGTYIHVDNTSEAQEDLNEQLTKLQKGETNSVVYSEYNEQFQAFAILALILLIVELCMLDAKNPKLKNIKIFSRFRYIMLLFVMMTAAIDASAQSDRQYIRNGNRLYRQQNYAKAEIEYRKAVGKNPRNAQAMYNLGCALLMQQKDSAAVAQLENAGKAETAKMRKAMVYHNIGIICQRHQMYGEAIEAYKESLRNNPHDDETRYNLALCMRQQKNQKDQDKNDKNKQDQKKDQKQDQKKDKQDKDKDKNQQQQQQQKEQMSKDNAEQLLNYAEQAEKATQQRLNKNRTQSQRRQLQKNW